MLVSSRGGNVGTNTQRRRRRVKGGKSKLGGKSYGGDVINVAAVLRRRMGGCLTSRVTPDPTHVPGSVW